MECRHEWFVDSAGVRNRIFGNSATGIREHVVGSGIRRLHSRFVVLAARQI